MNALFSPGVRLLEGFSFARKFQILFLLFILPLGYALWIIAGTYQERLALIDGELSGLRAIVTLDDALDETIAQRTLLARWKGTEVAAKATLEQRAGQLEAMLDKVDAQLKAESLEGANRALFDELKSRSEAIRPRRWRASPCPMPWTATRRCCRACSPCANRWPPAPG